MNQFLYSNLSQQNSIESLLFRRSAIKLIIYKFDIIILSLNLIIKMIYFIQIALFSIIEVFSIIKQNKWHVVYLLTFLKTDKYIFSEKLLPVFTNKYYIYLICVFCVPKFIKSGIEEYG